MPVTQVYPHSCNFSKKPCKCILGLAPSLPISGKDSIIFPNFGDGRPISDEDRRDKNSNNLSKAVLENSPITSKDGGFIVQGMYDSTCPPERTALHFTCHNCRQIWCYTSESELRQAFSTTHKKNNTLPNAFAFFTDEFDRLLWHLKIPTLIDSHTFW